MRYRYRAAAADGAELAGVLDAPSPAAALDELRRRALVPIALDAAEARPRGARRWRPGAAGARRQAAALAARTLATLLEAGVPLERALAFAAEQAGDDAVSAALADVRRAVRAGDGLAAALAPHAPVLGPLAVAMLGAGERSGALAAAAARLADHLDEGAELRAQVRAALLYPALMAVVAGVGVTVLLLVVVPRFVAMLDEVGGTLPTSTRVLVAASRVLVGGWWAWPLLAVAAVAGARAWLADAGRRARLHAARLTVPVVGPLEQRWAAARVARTLALLLAGGERLVPALRVAADASPNLAVAAGVSRAADQVSAGERLAPALAGVLPPLAVQLLAAGEEAGGLAPMAARVADVYEGEVRRALRAAVALLEPVLIVLFGLIVGFVALALLQAVYAVDPGRL